MFLRDPWRAEGSRNTAGRMALEADIDKLVCSVWPLPTGSLGEEQELIISAGLLLGLADRV